MDFQVEPGAVRRLAAAFEAAAERVGQVSGRLAAAVQLSSGAFGLLPEAQSARQLYLGKLQEAEDGLRNLQAGLQETGLDLRVVASNYEAADMTSAP